MTRAIALTLLLLTIGYAIPAARRSDDVGRLAGDPARQAIAARVKSAGTGHGNRVVRLLTVAVRLRNFRFDAEHCRARRGSDPERSWRGEVVHYTFFMIPILRVEVTCGGESFSYRPR